MKTIKFLTLALSICFFTACTARNDSTSNSPTTNEDSIEAPGVGVAPDNSNDVPDSTTQQADTTSVQRN